MCIVTELVIIFLLILANGVFAMSEISDRGCPQGPAEAARRRRRRARQDGPRRWRTIPASFWPPCRWASPWLACWPAPTAARRLRPSWRCRSREVALLAPYAEGIALGAGRRGDHVSLADHRRAGAQAHRAQQPRNHRVVGRAAHAVAVARRRPRRGAADGVDQPGAARVRDQGRGRAAPDRRRAQGAHQPGRGNRRRRRRRREHRPARVPAGRSARGRDHDAAARHRMDRRRRDGRRAARVPGVACAHAVRGVPGRPRQRARHRAFRRHAAAGVQGRGRSSSAR